MTRNGLLLLAALCTQSVASPALLPDRVEKAARERTEAGEYPALAIGYVEGDKCEVDVFGRAGDVKLDGDTVFEIGSLTKTFTATLLAQDVLSGDLTLDQPVAKLLPDFKIPSRNSKQISLLDLATQYSGLPRLPTNMSPADPANPYADYGADKLKSFLSGYQLPRDPGASYEYSNLGFGLLGYALAQHAHATYDDLVQQRLFEPLQMTLSGMSPTKQMRAHLAAGHGDDGSPARNWAFGAMEGAGGIFSSTHDMLNYLRMNMGKIDMPGGSTNALAHEPRRDVGGGARIGLAWMTQPRSEGDFIWHNGSTGGYRSFLGFSADGKRGVVIMTNSTTSVDDLGFAVFLHDAPLAPARHIITLDAASLDAFVGDYKLSDAMSINISRMDDQLSAKATGQGPFPIFAQSNDEFFARVADIRISFTRDTSGNVSGLVLHQNGDRAAPKLSTADAGALSSITLDASAMRDYVGRYQLAPNSVIDVTIKNDQLFTQLTRQPAFQLYVNAKDSFFLRVVDAQLTFERNGKGEIVAAVLHQNGGNFRAARIDRS